MKISVSSVAVNGFPVAFPSRDRIDWLTVDMLAEILVEASNSTSSSSHVRERNSTQIYHVINAYTTSWTSLAPQVLDLYHKAPYMQPVPYKEWVDTLRRTAVRSVDIEKVPAVKLLEFIVTLQRLN